MIPKFSLMTESVSIMDNSNTRINNKSNVYKHNSGQPIFLISLIEVNSIIYVRIWAKKLAPSHHR